MISFYHGLVGDHRHFSSVRDALPGALAAIDAPDMPFLHSDYDEIVARFGTQGAAPRVRVANSMGCGIALSAAGPCDQIILTAPSFDFSAGFVPLRKSRVRAWVTELYAQHGAIRDEAAFLDHAAAQMMNLLGSRAQIVFVIGQKDFTTPDAAFCAYVAAHLPRARVEVWEECGHAVPLDMPGRLADLIVDSWARIEVGQVPRTAAQ